jgi:hypothetical protein
VENQTGARHPGRDEEHTAQAEGWTVDRTEAEQKEHDRGPQPKEGEEKAGGRSAQLGSDCFAELFRLAGVAAGTGPATRAIAEGDGLQFDFFLAFDRVGVSGDGALAAAAHGSQEGAFGGDAVERALFIEPIAEGADAFIPGTHLDAQGGLSDAGNHEVGVKGSRQQSSWHRLSDQLTFRCDREVEASEAGGGQDKTVEFGHITEFLEAGDDVAPDFDDAQVGACGEQLGFSAGTAGGDDGFAGEIDQRGVRV